MSKDPKRFRINQLRIDSVQVDTEPSKTNTIIKDGETKPWEGWQDIVVSITTEDGSQFEVARVPVLADVFCGESTYTAKLTSARSWGTEKDDDSVSCPLCFRQGHGAGACEHKK